VREQLKRRLKCKQKRAPEMLLAALDEVIAPLAGQKTQVEAVVAKLNRMLELLEGYSFDFDAPAPRPAMPMMGQIVHFVSTTTGSW